MMESATKSITLSADDIRISRAGWLQFAGQWAACLENGISLQVRGRDTTAHYDGISY